ncbi:MAG TPA: Rieske 2Fe-2S domain-containing protein [Candidatus Elarobacter sp.]|jgi:phthalate 4,5-dioxygenase oxygenase subunit|nr:Rieske 2Fe-2S domain-containing protein [Candidatus Elarobacter sp.]
MLSRQENERLTRVVDAPMGEMMRRFWVPACLGEEVAEPDCAPLRTRIFGVPLVAFRDTAGRLGILDERCPHRLASLALGRNEEGGIRCVYHGWKFGADGQCLEMPTEPEGSTYRERMRTGSYPVRAAGGIVWTYLGPRGTEPPFPAFDWTAMPKAQVAIIKAGERVNYLQAVEGAIDSSHSWFLHRDTIWDWKKRSELSSDLSPKIEVQDEPYGFRYAAIRKPNENADVEKYVRVTQFVAPFTALIPRPLDRKEPAHAQIFVPVDDERTMFYGVFFSQNGEPVDEDAQRRKHHVVPGVDLDRWWFRLASEENWFNQDREAMKNGSYTGIKGFTNQDMACQESMGVVVDRALEHLGTSDVAIIRMRRRMLDALKRFEAGETPFQQAGVPYERLRGDQRVIPVGEPWQTVGAYAEPSTIGS